MPSIFEPHGSIEQRKFRLKQMADLCPKATRGIDLAKLPPEVFTTIEKNALQEARSNAATSGRLFLSKDRDEGGRNISTYEGDPRVWMAPFTAPSMICRINKAVDQRDVTVTIKPGQRVVVV